MPKLFSTDSRALRTSPENLADVPTTANWFAVYTYPHHEKRVSQHLTNREVEHFLPLYRAQRKWKDGSKVILDLPLFPGYLFVHITRHERTRVLASPGALRIVWGLGHEPAPLPEAEVNALRYGLHLHHAEPHPFLKVGHKVRIRSGALAGMEGVLVRKKSNFRVVLTVDLIMQSVAVEVEGADLEELDS